MQKIIYSLFVLSFLFIGCSNDDGPSIYFADENNTNYELFADEMELSISFIAEGDWYLSSISSVKNPEGGETQLFSWLGVNRVSGTAGTIELKATTTTNYTGSDRSVYITLVCGKNTLDFSITQKAKTKNGEIPEIKTRTYPKLVNTIIETENDTQISEMVFKYNSSNRITEIIKTYHPTEKDSVRVYAEKIEFTYPSVEYIVYSHQTIYTDSSANLEINEGAFSLNADGFINYAALNDNYSWKVEYENEYNLFKNVIVTNISNNEVYQNHITWTSFNATEVRNENSRSFATYSELENDNRVNVDFNWILGNTTGWESIITEKNTFSNTVMFGMEYYGVRSKNYRIEVNDMDADTGIRTSSYSYEYITDNENYVTEIVVSQQNGTTRNYKITYIDAK